jgi:hypothetical protein
MTVGSTYPNMNEFKLAIRQRAVKRDFEFNTEKSAPHRFIAHCKRKMKMIVRGGYMHRQQMICVL